MSMPIPPNPPNFGPPPPGPQPGHTGPEAVPCILCGHRARSHLDAGSCSARGRWLRHCHCGGYSGFDVADPA
jgi:hypothetical protein